MQPATRSAGSQGCLCARQQAPEPSRTQRTLLSGNSMGVELPASSWPAWATYRARVLELAALDWQSPCRQACSGAAKQAVTTLTPCALCSSAACSAARLGSARPTPSCSLRPSRGPRAARGGAFCTAGGQAQAAKHSTDCSSACRKAAKLAAQEKKAEAQHALELAINSQGVFAIVNSRLSAPRPPEDPVQVQPRTGRHSSGASSGSGATAAPTSLMSQQAWALGFLVL